MLEGSEKKKQETMNQPPDRIYCWIRVCARCGGDHKQLVFNRFARQPKEWTHWGICPQTQEPVLLHVVEAS